MTDQSIRREEVSLKLASVVVPLVRVVYVPKTRILGAYKGCVYPRQSLLLTINIHEQCKEHSAKV